MLFYNAACDATCFTSKVQMLSLEAVEKPYIVHEPHNLLYSAFDISVTMHLCCMKKLDIFAPFMKNESYTSIACPFGEKMMTSFWFTLIW